MPYITKNLKTVEYQSNDAICLSEKVIEINGKFYHDKIVVFNLAAFDITDELIENDFLRIFRFKCLNGYGNLEENFLNGMIARFPEELKIEYFCKQFWKKMISVMKIAEERNHDLSFESDVIIVKQLLA